MALRKCYDAVILGGGHNGLVVACYLAKAGLSVLILERNAKMGGATQSKQVFVGVDARLSVYSYLVSLFPDKIINDLGLRLRLKSRRTASWTPGNGRELLIRYGDDAANRRAFVAFTGNEDDYRGYLELQNMQEKLASVVWPSLTKPLIAQDEMRREMGREGEQAWQALIEEPLGNVIEKRIADDLIRGMIFTDGRIGLPTFPHDPTLLQNRSFLYHVIGRGTGEWRVPVGGMGTLVNELLRVARSTRKVEILTQAQVDRVHPGKKRTSVAFELEGKSMEVDARLVLCNASADVLNRLTEERLTPRAPSIEGSGFKMNMLLERLPQLRSKHRTPAEAFAGTFHFNEGYANMLASYQEGLAGKVPTRPPGELYCHTLTDHTILSEELNRRRFHTLTLFGLDMPYRLFEKDNEGVRTEVASRFLKGINQFLREPIESCLAKDANGKLCLEAMSAVDLETKLHLPKGNIFHGDLAWPFAETEEEVGQWGVETAHPNVFLCGSAAKRGGAVSGIPGHNAAMKVFEILRLICFISMLLLHQFDTIEHFPLLADEAIR